MGVSQLLKQNSGLSDILFLLYTLFLFNLLLGNSWYFDIFNQILLNPTLDDGAEDLLCDDKLQGLSRLSNQDTEVQFQHISKRSQIFKSSKNFKARGMCEDCRATGSSQCGPLIIQEECACVINNFACRI